MANKILSNSSLLQRLADADSELDHSRPSNMVGRSEGTIPSVGDIYYDFNSSQIGLLFIPTVLLMLLFVVPVFTLLRMVQPGGIFHVLIHCTILTPCKPCVAVTIPPPLVECLLIIERYHKANPEMFCLNGPYAQFSSIIELLYSARTAIGPLNLTSPLSAERGCKSRILFTTNCFCYTQTLPASDPLA